MQAVILAAGEGRRLRPLTLDRPKPLVEIAGRPLLDHIAAALPAAIDEIILVVGYRGSDINAHCGSNYFGRPTRYFEQRQPDGNGQALMTARNALNGRFLVLFADDLIDGPSLERGLKHEICLFASEHEAPQNFGVIIANPDGTVADILEKPANPPSNLVCTSALLLNQEIFPHIKPGRPGQESYLSRAVAALARRRPIPIAKMDFWRPVGRPEDIPLAADALTRRLTPYRPDARVDR